MIVFHGSQQVVERPEYGKGRSDNDFGSGFYLTESSELAKEWASVTRHGGFLNTYELQDESLRILDLTTADHSVLLWITLLVQCRNLRIGTPVEERGRAFLLRNYSVDLSEIDLVIGYRADDSFFSFARAFLSNTITVEQLEEALQLGDLGTQIVLKSRKAFRRIRFLAAEAVDGPVYYLQRNTRDNKAREDYLTLLKEDRDGTYLQDLIRRRK